MFKKIVGSLPSSITICFLLMGCGAENRENLSQTVSRPDSSEAETEGKKGSVSGGGGYTTKNSRQLLDRVVDELLEKLGRLRDIDFARLPRDWNVIRISEVISNIEMSYNKEVFRDDRELMFDFNLEKKSVEALKPFFVAYSWVTLDISESLKNAIKSDIEKKLLHEVSHLFGYDEAEATDFSKWFQQHLLEVDHPNE